MKLTPFAKFFITVVILGVIGYALWHYKSLDIRKWAGADKAAPGSVAAKAASGVSSDDFNALRNAPPDPERGKGAAGVSGAALSGSGKLSRQLVVAINTWAGHAPGIVAANGMESTASSRYKQTYGLNVKFVLLEDPAAKLAAFRKGDVDIMWNTVDNWAREASILAEQNQKAKSVVMQDWSRGGDGIVSLSAIKSIEELKGRKVSCTQFTPSHFLLLYLLAQSGLSADDRAAVEKNIVFTQDAPAAAAMFKAKQVDAAVTWEPDLSAAVTARGDEAHVLVSTTAATNIIADTLCARQDLIDRSPDTLRDFIHGWFDGIEMIKSDPNGAYAVVAKALKLDTDTVSGMLSGLKLTPYADNAQFYGLAGGKAHYETLFDTAFVIWRKKGLVTRPVEAKDWADTRFLSALAANYPRAEGGGAEDRGEGALVEGPRDPQQADPDPLHAGLRRDHAGLQLRPRRPRRDDDVLREHVSARGREHGRHGQPDLEHDAFREARPGREELRPEELPEHPAAALPDDRARLDAARGLEHDGVGAAAQPADGHQGRARE